MSRVFALPLVGLAAALLSSCGVNFDAQRYIEHEEKRYAAESVMDLRLFTFDGSMEVRAWDRPEIVVDVEKRGPDKASVAKIQLVEDRTGKRIQLEARYPSSGGIFLGYSSPSTRFVVNVPRKTNLLIRTGDGSILVERVEGRLELRSGDGSIKAIETAGELVAESGDGSIHIEGVAGSVDARTGDGSLRISGTPGIVRAHSGDGSVVLRVQHGAAMTGDWKIETGDGSITAELPDGFNADIEADPGSDGRARSDLGLVNVSGGTREGRTLRGRLGEGGHAFLLRTGDGTIRLSKS